MRKRLQNERIIQRPDFIVPSFWEKVRAVKELTLYAETKTGPRWQGKGTVLVISKDLDTVTFHENGFWQMAGCENIAFRNALRWTFHRNNGIFSLEHLRFGQNQPVFLFNLASVGDNLLVSTDPHLCKKDTYLAEVNWNRNYIHLSWSVLGPHKNEKIDCVYT